MRIFSANTDQFFKQVLVSCILITACSLKLFAQKPDLALTQKLLADYERLCNEIAQPNGLEHMEKGLAAAKSFSKLFVRRATVCNDLTQNMKAEKLDVFDYSRNMMLDFQKSGLNTKLDFARLSVSQFEQHAEGVMFRVLLPKTLKGNDNTGKPFDNALWIEVYITEKNGKWLIHHIDKGKPGGESVAKGNPVHLTQGEDFITEIGTLSMKLVYVKGGSFSMGQPDPNIGGKNLSRKEQPAHTETVGDFWVAEHELTQAMYQAIMGEGTYKPDFFITPKNDDGSMYGPNLPARIDFYQAVAFCNALSKKNGLPPYYALDKSRKDPDNKNTVDPYRYFVGINEGSDGYRLPTEAEWEYAAMGGNAQQNFLYAGTSSGNLLNKHANYADATYYDAGVYKGDKKIKVKESDNYGELAPVKSFAPNNLGLYDMSGNLSEWCWNWLTSYALQGEQAVKDEQYGIWRVHRGGSYKSIPYSLRIKSRSGSFPAERQSVTLRLTRSQPKPASEHVKPNQQVKPSVEPKQQKQPSKMRRKGKWKQ